MQVNAASERNDGCEGDVNERLVRQVERTRQLSAWLATAMF